jgi:CAAX protease family protein
MGKKQNDGNNGYILAFILLVSPFYLNDFANIYVQNWALWLFIDYAGVKLFPLGVAFWLIYSQRMDRAQFGLTMPDVRSFLTVFLVVTLAGTLIDQNFYPLLAQFPGYKALGGMPAIGNPFWDWVDLTFGLFMVGVCEELVFRGFLHTFICRYTKNSYAIVGISSVAFGLIHWSLGLDAVIVSAIIGAVFMIVYLKTRSLLAIVSAHFAINFIDFAGVIPKSVFIFFK